MDKEKTYIKNRNSQTRDREGFYVLGSVHNIRNTGKRLVRSCLGERYVLRSRRCLRVSVYVSGYIQASEPRSFGACGRPLVGVGGLLAFSSCIHVSSICLSGEASGDIAGGNG